MEKLKVLIIVVILVILDIPYITIWELLVTLHVVILVILDIPYIEREITYRKDML